MAIIQLKKKKQGYIYDGGKEEKIIAQYQNGNYQVTIGEFGTKIRENDLDNLTPSFPENIDIKVTNCCSAYSNGTPNGKQLCNFCHEGSTPDGQHGIMEHEFLKTLKSGQELAIGGGSIFEWKELDRFLTQMKKQGVLCNITVNQHHLIDSNIQKINTWQRGGYVYGVGVSWNGKVSELKAIHRQLYKPENMVVHTIAGLHNLSDLYDEGFKVLILGYKNLRRGAELFQKFGDKINNKIEELRERIIQDDFFNRFIVVSFDNLAIEQLRMQEIVDKDIWDRHYMGDDGTFTMYIDLVKGEFASSSTSMTRYSLNDYQNIETIFKTVLEEK